MAALPTVAQEQLFFEDFSAGLGAMSEVAICGAGSIWALANTCPDSGSAPSPPNHARFGEVPGCASYSDGNVSLDLQTPFFATGSCRQLTFWYSYLLDFNEDSSYDRATVLVSEPPGGLEVVLADNGDVANPNIACSGFVPVGRDGLVSNAIWHQNRHDLSILAPLGTLGFAFNGETFDQFNNIGQGFLIDDVRLYCSRTGDQFQVNSYTTNYQMDASVAMSDSGDFVVSWASNGSSEGDSSDGSIQAQRFAADGAALGSQFQVNSYTSFSQDQPKVGMDDEGSFVIVWDSFGAPDPFSGFNSILGQRFDTDGSPMGAEFQVNTYTTSVQSYGDLTVASDGSFIVVWTSTGSSGSDGDTDSIQARRYETNGSPVGSDFQVNSYTSSRQYDGAVAVASDGSFVVVWTSYGSFGSDNDFTSIQAQRFAASGAPNGGQFQVNTTGVDFQREPAVAVGPSGDFVVVWRNAAYPYDSIRAQRITSGGTFIGNEFEVNTYTTYFLREPSVATSGQGDFLISWEGQGSPGSDQSSYSIQARKFRSDGAPIGSQYQVNSYVDGRQFEPAVAGNSSGEFVVVWNSMGSFSIDSSSFSIQARQLGAFFADGFESGDTSAWTSSSP